jgi:hypothetical protein
MGWVAHMRAVSAMAKARIEQSGCLGAGHESGAQMKGGSNRKLRFTRSCTEGMIDLIHRLEAGR